MKPPAFDYLLARSVEEVHSFLQQYGSDARILAGGQSLIPMMKMRLARPAVLVDINKISQLDFIRAYENKTAIGATRRLQMLETDDLSRAGKMFSEALPHIGHVATRHRGTICGSFAYADPAAELPTIGLCLDAEVLATSARGMRQISVDKFFLSFFTTSLEADEMIQEVRFPRLPDNAGCSFIELSKRHAKFALAAVVIFCAPDQRIAQARIAIGAIGERPIRARDAERALVGEIGSLTSFRAAAAASIRELDPPSDVHGSGAFRKKVAEVLVERALKQAWRRAVPSENREVEA